MRVIQRCTILVTVAMAGLATVAAPAAAASAPGPLRAPTSCIRVSATIHVGRSPVGVAANRKTNTVYVANGGSKTVAVISGRTNTVTATIPVGLVPVGVAANPKTNTIYVTNENDNTV